MLEILTKLNEILTEMFEASTEMLEISTEMLDISTEIFEFSSEMLVISTEMFVIFYQTIRDCGWNVFDFDRSIIQDCDWIDRDLYPKNWDFNQNVWFRLNCLRIQ